MPPKTRKTPKGKKNKIDNVVQKDSLENDDDDDEMQLPVVGRNNMNVNLSNNLEVNSEVFGKEVAITNEAVNEERLLGDTNVNVNDKSLVVHTSDTSNTTKETPACYAAKSRETPYKVFTSERPKVVKNQANCPFIEDKPLDSLTNAQISIAVQKITSEIYPKC